MKMSDFGREDVIGVFASEAWQSLLVDKIRIEVMRKPSVFTEFSQTTGICVVPPGVLLYNENASLDDV